jgi:hypothetical protein
MKLFRIDPSTFCRSRSYLAFVLIATVLLLSHCAGKRPSGIEKAISGEVLAAEREKCQKMEKENQRLKVTLTRQTSAYRELERKIAMLQLGLMKKDIEIEEPIDREALLQKKLDEAIQEVVRAKAKLRSLESKAEAASNIAEAEVALKDLKERATGQETYPEVIQAEYLLVMSAQEFKRENYSGALYVTSQAKSLVRMGEERLTDQEKPPKRVDPVPFALPVPLQVLKRSNVREGPGFEFNVLFTVEKGNSVIGHSYKGEWVQVRSEDNREGWIFHTLLDWGQGQ